MLHLAVRGRRLSEVADGPDDGEENGAAAYDVDQMEDIPPCLACGRRSWKEEREGGRERKQDARGTVRLGRRATT